MTRCFVVALSGRRRGEWERVFGTDRLPVLGARPRWAELREGPAWVFDLALGRLHPGQLNRLAAYVARRRGVGYEAARAWVEEGVVIRAEGVMIVTADAEKDVGRFRSRRLRPYAIPFWSAM